MSHIKLGNIYKQMQGAKKLGIRENLKKKTTFEQNL